MNRENMINKFMERYYKELYYTNNFKDFDYKHYFIFENSNEIAYAFSTDIELDEFLKMNKEFIEG